jgi:hypothetical protein
VSNVQPQYNQCLDQDSNRVHPNTNLQGHSYHNLIGASCIQFCYVIFYISDFFHVTQFFWRFSVNCKIVCFISCCVRISVSQNCKTHYCGYCLLKYVSWRFGGICYLHFHRRSEATRGNTSDIGTMRPGPAGKASFPCVYLNTTPRVGCGVTGVYGRSHHSKSRHYMEVSRQPHFPTTWLQNKCLRSCTAKRPAGSQNLSGSSERQKNLCQYRELNLDSWVFEPVLMLHYDIRDLRGS